MKNKRMKERFAIAMMIFSGICLTGLSMLMAVGSDRL
jgi:cytochrome c-type biogenesis protein CcmE